MLGLGGSVGTPADGLTGDVVVVRDEKHLDELAAAGKVAGKIAKIRADGTLVMSETKGSIHQVGAKLEGAPSCNGWTYWHFRREGKTVPIDILRQQIRSELSG